MTQMLEELAVYRHTPSRSAMAHELMAALEGSLQRLPEDCHTALRLRYMEGLDVADAATRMKRTSGSLQMLCCRGLKALRKDLRADSPSD